MSRWVYRVKETDADVGVTEGDLIVCGPMHWAWAQEKVAGIWRVSDGRPVGMSFYRSSVEYVEPYDVKKHGKEPTND